MSSRRRVKWTEAGRAALEALVSRANGRRTARMIDVDEVERCAARALEHELGLSWSHAGEPPDARAFTSVCLAVIDEGFITIGVAAAHAPATPASAWSDIPAWDRYWEAANVAPSRAWAARLRPDRVRFELEETSRPSTASQEELWAAVLAEPDDDAPRLVLADWLTERGDPRGEFISLQCELARGVEDETELRARERLLLEAHGPQWLHGVGGDLLRVRFERGFASRVEVLDATAMPLLEPFFAREPVRSLAFTTNQRLDAARFSALPWVGRLRALEFRAPRPQTPAVLTRAQLPYLLEARGLRQLRRLAFVSQWLGDDGFELLAERGGAAFPELEALAVEEDMLTVRGLRPYVESRWASRFTELSLAGNQFGVEGVEALAASRRPGLLHSLTLDHNALGNSGASALARAPRFGSLKHLSLRSTRITAPGAEALLQSEVLRGLESLDLEGNQLGALVRERLADRFGR